jgi:lysophospholipase L1-like esterase
LLIIVFWACYFSVCAQKNGDFSQEVEHIRQKYESVERNDQKNVVFTGSSSIRLWEDLEQSFPDHRIINTGFGGSESSDLLEYIGPLILDFRPVKVFIYEGDNDLSYRKSPGRIFRTTRKILERIWASYPETPVVLIAAKPSPVRWHMRRRFRRLNRKFERFAKKSTLVEFADVWDVMLDRNKLDDSLFAEDGLHMNKKGYALWYDVLKTYLN